MNKKKFWDNCYWISLTLFVISLILTFILPEKYFDNNLITLIWFFLYCMPVFVFGMIYNSIKYKRYWWAFFLLITFGNFILPTIFYFAVLRKEFEKA